MVRQWLSGLKLRTSLSSKGSRFRPLHRRRRAGHGRRAWVLEGLEGRVLLSSSPTVYTVNSTGSGSTGTGISGTLPYVIGQANANPNTGGSLIEFDSTVFPSSSSTTITLTGTLSLSETAGPEVIDGPGSDVARVSGDNSFGVLSIASNTLATINGLTIADGATSSNGGGILNSGTLTLTNSTITGSSAGNAGGGVDNLGTATITDSILSSNTALVGGGIETSSSSGSLTVASTYIVEDGAQDNGGGIEVDRGTTTVSNSLFEDDTAGTGGGGVNTTAGTTTITDSTFAEDQAVNGAGIANAGTLSITNTTLAQNTATTAGGGIDNSGTLTAVNVTIAANDVGSSGTGGGLDAAAGTAALDNTIVATNSAGTGNSATASDIAGTVSSSSAYNLIGTGGSGGLSNGTNQNLVDVAAPDLGTLIDNGGPTPTIALLQGSPAIDAGGASISGVSVPTTDQRGALRGPVGLNAGSTVDIGAYEASSSFLVTSTAATFDAGALPTAVEWADLSTNTNPANVSTPDANTIVFDTSGVFATAQTITLTSATGPLSLTNTTTDIAIEGPDSDTLTISGGGVVQVFSMATGVTATLSILTISGGSAASGGGIDNAGTLTVNNSTIANNLATDTGGGVDNSGTMTINGGSVTGNTVMVAGNTVMVADGGGIENTGTLTIGAATISGNLAEDTNPNQFADGGGVDNSGTMTINESTISGNSADGGVGGGIDNLQGTATITNSTITGNTAVSGGGISNDVNATTLGSTNIGYSFATLTTISTTIADNVATGGAGSGGGLWVTGGAPTLYDTIVAMNTDSSGAASDISLGGGSISSSSAYDLIGTGGSGGLTQGTNHNQVGVVDPGLGSLESNGGYTQTMALLPGSPAIGAGTSLGVDVPTTDQRGVARPADSYDIGAFQDRGFTITVVSGDGTQSATVDTAFANPLAVVVASPYGDPVVGGIVSFTPASTGASATLSADFATIGANGEAQVTATANGQGGSYTVTASVLGTSTPASFALTNIATVTPVTVASVTGVAVLWGRQIASLVVPSSSGGLLLPAGRVTDLPWLGIDVIQITLSQAETLTSSDIALRSARGIKYKVVGISSNGTSYALFLSRAINAADRITLTITATDLTTFSGQLNVLPGDFNDNGVVNRQDYYDVRAEKLGLGSASLMTFADINGDGVVNTKDLNLVRQRIGTRLPRQGATTRAKVVEARPRLVTAVRVVPDHPGDFRRKSRFPR
jgi:hypothetical protein